MRKHSILPFFIPHLGCPHQCVFCNQRSITGFREPIAVKEIEERIERFVNEDTNSSVSKEVAYYGGSFTAMPEAIQKQLLEPAARAMRENKIKRIRISTRPDYIRSDALNLLKKYNVTLVELGIQSLDERVLKGSGRGHGRGVSLAAIDLLKKNGFEVGAQLMIGLPFDSYSKSIETAREIVKRRPDYVRIYPALVIKGTVLEKMYYNNEYSPMSLGDSINLCKQMAILFRDARIKLIRIGLHPDQELLKPGLICAGPFHPAYGELVKSSMALDLLLSVIKQVENKEQGSMRIEVPFSDASIFIGQKKSNVKYLSSLLPELNIKIVGSPFHNMIKIIMHKRELIAHYSDGFREKKMVEEK
ncbi:MAG: elongator complex protein 3 [bacterium]